MKKLKKEDRLKSKEKKASVPEVRRRIAKAKPVKEPVVKRAARVRARKPVAIQAKAVIRKLRVTSVQPALKPQPIAKKKAIPREITAREVPSGTALISERESLSAKVAVQPLMPEAVTAWPEISPPIERRPVEKEPVQEKEVAPPAPPGLKELELKFPLTVKDLAVKIQEKPSLLIKELMNMGAMAGINQVLAEALVAGICARHGFKIKRALGEEELALQIHKQEDPPQMLKPRPPIVTLMGHVDHGKTSLLDAIRKTKVAELEHGGITQHIGAYRVVLPHGEITFLDTPGHEAFTAMRSRGAQVTDMVVLVVAADDGVMPQTIEAIDHSRAAGVSIIVAINKVDKPQANAERVKKQLSELGLTPEEWSGKTITVSVSAKTGEGIDALLEMILLEAQILELKANPQRPARGVVLEAELTKARGPVTTLLVQNGTLRLNDNILVEKFYGKIKAMFDHHGRTVVLAGPSSPVVVLGLSGIPQAGEQFFVVGDEKTARELARQRYQEHRQQQIGPVKRISLEDLYSQIKEGKIKELKLIVKADVQGSLGAIRETLAKLNVSEIKLNIIHQGVGSVNTSDVILAAASDALVLGFNVQADIQAQELIAKEGVQVNTYNIIYELANDIKAAVEGMLEPKLKRVFSGRVQVKQVFKLSRHGMVAGCFVSKGKINRNANVMVLRDGETVFEGRISSLKRFKDDVRDVAEGFECGLAIGGFEDIKEGDIIEAYDIEKIARKL